MWGEGKGAHAPVLRSLSLHTVDVSIRRKGSCKSGTGEKLILFPRSLLLSLLLLALSHAHVRKHSCLSLQP